MSVVPSLMEDELPEFGAILEEGCWLNVDWRGRNMRNTTPAIELRVRINGVDRN
jgi:hypothetical protein